MCYGIARRSNGKIKFRVTGVEEDGAIHRQLQHIGCASWEKADGTVRNLLLSSSSHFDGEIKETEVEAVELDKDTEMEDRAVGGVRLRSYMEEAAREIFHRHKRSRSIEKEEKYSKEMEERCLNEAREAIVYLTSDAENVMVDLEPTKFYIIGGIVDHNRMKGLTFNTARALSINTAALPINDFIQVAGVKVLTINHGSRSLSLYPNSGEKAHQLTEGYISGGPN